MVAHSTISVHMKVRWWLSTISVHTMKVRWWLTAQSLYTPCSEMVAHSTISVHPMERDGGSQYNHCTPHGKRWWLTERSLYARPAVLGPCSFPPSPLHTPFITQNSQTWELRTLIQIPNQLVTPTQHKGCSSNSQTLHTPRQ